METIQFHDVCIAYGEFLVVDQFNLVVEPGELICLFGPSGCGKSSILKTVAGAIKASGGEVRIGDIAAENYDSPLSYMPQENELFRWLNIRENVVLWHRESAKRAKVHTAIPPDEALSLVELTDAVDKMPFQLSGGMARRTALARCLATDASIMLLDETFISIEQRLRRKVMVAVRTHLKQKGITALLVSHDYEEAAFMSDRVVFLSAVPAQIHRITPVSLPNQRTIDLFDGDGFRQATLDLVRS
ncbi:MAG: NitT/TauT family transport system ATP-binding protein [Verrucomicrobiota bacterium]